jgi:uncharacterized protein
LQVGFSVRNRYIPRELQPVLQKAAAQFPAVVLTGSRQSGKTTLLEMHPAPVIFDEVQYAPELLPYSKENIDEGRDNRGQYF